MHFEIYERERSMVSALRGRLMGGGDWRWRLERGDGETIAAGDNYPDPLRSRARRDAAQARNRRGADQLHLTALTRC